MECHSKPAMSADQITDARIAELRRWTDAHQHLSPSECREVMAALTASRAEVEQARIELEDERERVNVQREDIRTLRMEVQRLRDEAEEGIRRLDEARRSDAGRVEVRSCSDCAQSGHCVEAKYGTACVDFLTRLSPSPQPETGADDARESHPIGTADSGYFRRELRSLLERMSNADGPWLARYLVRLAAVAEPSPQPSADVVVVPREEWEALVHLRVCAHKWRHGEGSADVLRNASAGADALRSTNHDAQDAGEGR